MASSPAPSISVLSISVLSISVLFISVLSISVLSISVLSISVCLFFVCLSWLRIGLCTDHDPGPLPDVIQHFPVSQLITALS